MEVEISTLYDSKSLDILHQKFLNSLKEEHLAVYNKLTTAQNLDSKSIIELAPHIEKFIIDIFEIHKEVEELRQENIAHNIIHECKRQFVQRYAIKQYKSVENFHKIESELKSLLNTENITDQLFATSVTQWYKEESKEHEIEVAAKYASWRVENLPSILFSVPKKLDYCNETSSQ